MIYPFLHAIVGNNLLGKVLGAQGTGDILFVPLDRILAEGPLGKDKAYTHTLCFHHYGWKDCE